MEDHSSVTDWKNSGTWASFGELRLFIRIMGEGKAVLVLHGFPTSSYDFSRVVLQLSKTYKLILFDYPGFGFSDKPKTIPYSLFLYADAAQDIATRLGFNRIYILAHDIGTSVALELLRRNRLIIENLVFLNGSVLSIPIKDYKMLVFQKLLLHPLIGSLIGRLSSLGKPFFTATFQKVFFKKLSHEELEAFWSLLKYNQGVKIYHLLIRYMIERWEHQQMWLDTLESHNAPLTLIWGQEDPVAPPAVADYIVNHRADVTYIPLANVGHYPHWEAPSIVAAKTRQAFG